MGYRLTMAGDRTLTMAGDQVTTMSGIGATAGGMVAVEYLDTFTRSDHPSDLGSIESHPIAWIEEAGVWGIGGGKVSRTGGTPADNDTAKFLTGGVDQYVEANVAYGGYNPALGARMSDTNNLYFQFENTSDAMILKKVSGSYYTVASGLATSADGDQIAFQVHGSGATAVCKYWKNGSLVTTVTDNSGPWPPDSNYVGMRSGVAALATWDNFRAVVQEVAAAASVVPQSFFFST